MSYFLHGRPHPFAAHITTSATTNAIATDTTLHSILITTSTAGTAWVVTIQNKEATPKIAYISSGTGVTVGTVNVSFPQGIPMTGGIDIITTGTPGVMDVFLVFE